MMRKRIKNCMAATLTALSLMVMPMPVMAAGSEINIDGAFDDWSAYASTQFQSGQNSFEEGTLTYDDKYAYLYLKEFPSGSSLDRVVEFYYFNLNGTVRQIKVVEPNWFNSDKVSKAAVNNSWYQNIMYSDAMHTRKNGVNRWEIKVPLESLLRNEANEITEEPKAIDVKNLSVTFWDKGTQFELAGVAMNSDEEKPSTPGEQDTDKPGTEDEPVIPEGPADDTPTADLDNTSNIVIDGYYDDWENVPGTEITYGSWGQGSDILEHHTTKLAKDDKYLYINANMCDTYNQQIPLDDLRIIINGQEQAFFIRYVNDDGTPNWDGSIYNLAEGIQTNVGIFKNGDARYNLGQAAVTIVKNKGDHFEIAIAFDELLKYYNVSESEVNNGAKIEFYSPNIGPQRATIVGTSTAPYIGVAICVVAAAVTLFMRRNKRRESN